MLRNLLLVFLFTSAIVVPARSEIITVTGGCSLIDAVTAANTDAVAGGCVAGAGADTIMLGHDVTLNTVEEVWLELFDTYNFGPSGLPVVRTTIIVEGGGYTIARQGGAPQFRIFSVAGGGYGAGDLTLRNVTLSNGYLNGGGLPFFTTNVGERAAGGAILSLQGAITIEDSLLTGNAADNGGALAVAGGSYSTFNSEFANNQALLLGGAVDALFTIADINRTRFADNHAETSGGAIAHPFGVVARVADSSFLRNSAHSGGAIHNTSVTSDLTLVNTLMQDNFLINSATFPSSRRAGAALENFNAASATIRGSLLTGNLHTDIFGTGGGAISVEGSGAGLALIDSELRNNGAGANPPTAGGGVYVDNGDLSVRGSVLDGNVARNRGGGIAASGNSSVIVDASTLNNNSAGTEGGGAYAMDSDMTFNASVISSNLAGLYGGGAYAAGVDGLPQLLTISDSQVTGNADIDGAPGDLAGAGIMIEDYTDGLIVRSAIISNTGGGLSGFSTAGSAINADGSVNVDVINSTLAGNDASPSGGGGAIFSGNFSNVDIAFSTIIDNTAWRGGAIRAISGVSIEGTILADNIALADTYENCAEFYPPTDNGANLADDDSCGGAVAVVSDVDLALGAVALNGGATETAVPGAGSVAIDYFGTACAVTEGVDQRGVPRDSTCDAGAVEAAGVLPLIGFESAALEVIEGLDAGFDATIVLDNTLGDLEAGEVTVWPILKGSAAYDGDYTLLDDTTPIIFAMPAPGASTTKLLNFDLNDDDEAEGDENLVLSFVFAGPATPGTELVHTVSILDNDTIGPGACTVLQEELQTLMGDEDPNKYRNHGRYVSPVAKLTSRALRNGEITTECKGCIVSQFARSIPIAEQTVCGGSATLIAVRRY